MEDGHETPMSDACSDSWEIRLEARLSEHDVPDPATVVARWKRHREAALVRKVTDLKTQLTTTQAGTAPQAGSSTPYGPHTTPDEHIFRALNGVHARMADAESRLLTVARNAGKAVDRLERAEGELQKSLAVLNDRLAVPNQGRQPRAGGLGAVIGFGAALATVVVALVLALSLMLRSVAP